MMLAVIADIHGNAAALEAVLADIERLGIREIVNLGDCLSGPLEAGRTADRLMALGLPTVRGNHDRYLIEIPSDELCASDAHAYGQLSEPHLDWLRSLPFSLVHREEIFLCHATPNDDSLYWLEQVSADGLVSLQGEAEIAALAEGVEQPLILCAHSHVPRVVQLPDGRLIVNPGSVGCPAYDDDLPYVHKVETGHALASYAVLEKREGCWTPQFRTVAYDNMAMSELAARNGRADWAKALATGRV
ncbi:MAG: metallophosphoesterase family protein [Pseudorhizobium sp.]